MGFICAQYTVKSVLLIFALTFVLIVALTIFAVVTKADFTGCGAYIMVLGLVIASLAWPCACYAFMLYIYDDYYMIHMVQVCGGIACLRSSSSAS